MTIDIFKERLSEFRKKENLTQREIAEKIGVTPATFSAYEKGKNMPTAQILAKLSEEYGVSIDWLLGVENQKPQAKTYADLLRLLSEFFDAFDVKTFLHEYNDDRHRFMIEDRVYDDHYYRHDFASATNQLYSLHKMKSSGNLTPDLYDSVVSSLCDNFEKEIDYEIFHDNNPFSKKE